MPDVSNLYYYDAMWRLLEEHARGRFDVSEDDDWAIVQPDSGDLVRITQRFWNLHYIDDLIAWQSQDGYDSGGSGWVEPDGEFKDAGEGAAALFYALTDRLFSVIGVLDGKAAGYALIERVRYTAYGSTRHIPIVWGDITGDGEVNFDDQGAVLAAFGASYTQSGYNPDADFDQKGSVGFDDYGRVLANQSASTPEGLLSLPGVGNTIGYTGHHFDPATGMTLARHRWLEHDLGRWMTRDPAGYVDGMSLDQFVKSSPTILLDPFGLSGSANPAALKGWVAAAIVPLNPYDATVLLLSLGIGYSIIATEVGVSLDYVQSVASDLDNAIEGAVNGMIKIHTSELAEMTKEAACRESNRLYSQYCKHPNQPKGCAKMNPEKGDCKKFHKPARHAAKCIAGRTGIMLYCGNRRPGQYNDEIEKLTRLMRSCLTKYVACRQRNQEGADIPIDDLPQSAPGPDTAPNLDECHLPRP